MSDDILDVEDLEDLEPESKPTPEEEPSEEERRPGFFTRLGQRITAPLAQLTSREILTWRLAFIGGGVLLLLWLLWCNRDPVRIVLWFWTIDMPKAIAFILDVALGALLMWLWMRTRARHLAEGKEEARE